TYVSPAQLVLSFIIHDTAPAKINTLSLHDALPISLAVLITGVTRTASRRCGSSSGGPHKFMDYRGDSRFSMAIPSPERVDNQSRSEEHTSELQSRGHLVCRLLLEKKKTPYFTGPVC